MPHHWDVEHAQRNGAILIFTDPRFGTCCGTAKPVVSVVASSGSTLYVGNEVWVRSQLKKYEIDIVREHKW